MTTSRRKIPLAHGALSAGEGCDYPPDGHDLLDINELVTGGREGCIAFRVTGDSMCPPIEPGAIVIVDPHASPRNGQPVAVRVGGRCCVKQFRHTDQGLYLVSSNTAFSPRRVTADDDFEVLGVIKGHVAVYPT